MSGSGIASIILSGVAGQQPLYDPVKAQQIQGNRLALLQQEGQVKGENALAKIYQDPKNIKNGMLTPNALATIMGINPATGMQIAQQQAKTQDLMLKAAKDQRAYIADNIATPAIEAYQTALQTMPQPAAMAAAQGVYSAALDDAKASGLFSADQIAKMSPQFNPVTLGAGLENYATFVKQQQAQEGLEIKADGGGKKRGPVMVPGVNEPMGPAPAGGGGVEQPSGGGGGQQPGISTKAPAGLPSVPGLTPGAADVAYQNYISTGTMPSFGNSKAALAQRDAFLNYIAARQQQPTDPNAPPDPIATAIANYDMQISPYMMRTPAGRKIMDQVLAINPQYDATQYAGKNATVQAFDKGPQGNSVRSLDVGIQHLNVLQPLVAALANGNNQTVNRLGNAFATEFGGTAPTNFDTTKQIVADEIAKAIVGGQTAQADREKASDLLSSAESPQQLNEAIAQIKKLMAGQLVGLRQQYTSSTGLPDAAFNSKLLPVTLQELGNAGDDTGGASTPATPSPGTVMDGYVFNGGDPADPKSWTKQ